MGPILKMDKVCFRYGRGWAVEDISLEAERGEVIGLLGPNGSGKSTLLGVIDGLAVPQKGNVLIKGIPIRDYSRQALAREVAMVPQENHFSFSFSVLEVVLMGRFPYLGNFRFEGKKDLDVVNKVLSATGTLSLADRPITGLSGGEKQRVLLARALAQEPSIILLDEPTAFLDLSYKKEIFDLISSLARKTGVSALVVTHDIDLAARYCNRLVMIRNGRIYAGGAPAQVLNPDNIEAVYGCRVFVDKNPLSGSPRVSLL
jgi:iron complex transport system ATP-binding protein